MKKWLVDRFLPMWAKETVLAENRRLNSRIQSLEHKIACLQSYLEGQQNAIKHLKRIRVYAGGEKQ